MSAASAQLLNAGAGGVAVSDNSLEKARAELHQYSQALLIAAVFVLFSFWAVYFFPFVLLVGAVATGLLQYTHTKDYDTMMTNSSIAGPSQVFRYLHLMNLGGIIVGSLSALCCVISLIVNASSDDFNTLRFVFTGIAFGAILTITALAYQGTVRCKEVDAQVVALLTGGMAGVPTSIAAAGAPVMGAYAQQQPIASYGTGGGGYGTAAPLAFSETPKQSGDMPQ